jgi:hypothetical protein
MEDLASDHKPNFTSAKIEVIIEEVKLKEPILFGKYLGRSSAVFCQAAWEIIVKKVTAVGMGRSVKEVQKKLTTLRSAVKLKLLCCQQQDGKPVAGLLMLQT